MAQKNLRRRRAPVKSQIVAEFAAATRVLREARGLTIEQLAERSGIPLKKMQRIEAGTFDPYIQDLIRLAKGFEMDAGEFCTAVIKPGERQPGGDR